MMPLKTDMQIAKIVDDHDLQKATEEGFRIVKTIIDETVEYHRGAVIHPTSDMGPAWVGDGDLRIKVKRVRFLVEKSEHSAVEEFKTKLKRQEFLYGESVKACSRAKAELRELASELTERNHAKEDMQYRIRRLEEQVGTRNIMVTRMEGDLAKLREYIGSAKFDEILKKETE
jgi:hypothetical protein